MFETVGSLPCQSLLHLALDAVFEEYPEVSAIQTKVYHILKCHLSVINHSSITQFDDITLSNHDFDKVAGVDLHSVSGPDSRPDLSVQTDFNETFYSVFSQAQRQVHSLTERSLGRCRRVRANLCPDIVKQIDREFEDLLRNNTHYITANGHLCPIPPYPTRDQHTQTRLHVIDTDAQYSSPTERSDHSSSDSELDSDIEDTENITIAKRYLHRHSLSQEDLYNYPTLPRKRFRTSTPDPMERRPEEEPIRCLLREIVNHRPALMFPLWT